MVGADPTGREQLRTALIACGADLTHFEDTDLDKLWVGRYRNVSSLLEDATWRGLSAAGLPPGLVDQILALQGRAASAAGAGGPDTSHAYMRLALAGAPPQPPGCSGSSSAVLLSGGGNNLQQQLAQHLDQPLAVKLPVGRGLSRDALNSSSELLDYVQEQPLHGLGADARRLTVLMTSVLTGVFEDCWSGAAGSAECSTSLRMALLVDAPLALAAASLALDCDMDRRPATCCPAPPQWRGCAQTSSSGFAMRCFSRARRRHRRLPCRMPSRS